MKAFDEFLTAQIRSAVAATPETADSFAAQSKVLRIEYEDAKYKAWSSGINQAYT